MKMTISAGRSIKYRNRVYLVSAISQSEITQVAEVDSVEDSQFRVSNLNADYLDTKVEPYAAGDIITIKSHTIYLRCQGEPSFDINLYYHVTKEKKEDEQQGTDSSDRKDSTGEVEGSRDGVDDRDSVGHKGIDPADRAIHGDGSGEEGGVVGDTKIGGGAE